MKKRKIKLFASLTSLVMVVAVMAVGIWAAASQSVSMTTSLTFQATNIQATLSAIISGNEGDARMERGESDAALDDTTPVEIAKFGASATNGDEIGAGALTFAFKDANNNGTLETTEKVTFTITIKNDGPTTLYYKATITGSETTIDAIIAASSNATGNIATGAEEGATIVIEFNIHANTTEELAANSDIGITIAMNNTGTFA